MKVVKVRIIRGGGGESAMKYPARYDPQEIDRLGRGPSPCGAASAYSGGLMLGEAEEFCIIILPDAVADEYALGADMEILTSVQADALIEQWRIDRGDTEEIVLDDARISVIQAKQSAGIALTVEDLKALDVNDSTPGINKRRRNIEDVYPALKAP